MSRNRREILFRRQSSVSAVGLAYYHLSADGTFDLENKIDKYSGPIPFEILQVSTAIVLMDEIRNEAKSLVDNQILLSEIESFKPNRSTRSCEKVKLSDSKDTRLHLYNMTLQSTLLYIRWRLGKKFNEKLLNSVKKILSKLEDQLLFKTLNVQ